MPDEAHVVAFLCALAGIALVGLAAFIYIWRGTARASPRAKQLSLFATPIGEAGAADVKPTASPAGRV